MRTSNIKAFENWLNAEIKKELQNFNNSSFYRNGKLGIALNLLYEYEKSLEIDVKDLTKKEKHQHFIGPFAYKAGSWEKYIQF